MACNPLTLKNDANDRDRRQGKSSSKMDEVDSVSVQPGLRLRVCKERARDATCRKSFWLAEG